MFISKTSKRFTMSDAEYFGNGLPGHISNSKLGLINPKQGGSLVKYNSGFEDSKSEFFRLGTAIHALLLEPETYQLSDMTAPTGVARSIIDTVYKLVNRDVNPIDFEEAIDMAITIHNYYGGNPGPKRRASLIESTKLYYDYLCQISNAEGIILLSPEMKATTIACVKAINEDNEAISLIRPQASEVWDEKYGEVFAFNEDVITCKYKVGDRMFDLKSKIDSWSIDIKNKVLYINDLKTTSANVDTFMGVDAIEIVGFCDMQRTFIHGSFHKYHYYRQMYMYGEMVKLVAEEEYGFDPKTWTVKYNMVVVETTGLHRSRVFSVTDDLILAGQIEMEFLMKLVAENTEEVKYITPTITTTDDIFVL